MFANVLQIGEEAETKLNQNDKFNTYEKYPYETETAFLPMCCQWQYFKAEANLE